jgi:ATP-binding protein involved in chromosome partitioning
MGPTEEQVYKALSKIIDPDLGRDIVSLGMIKDLRIEDGVVHFTFELTTPACPVRDKFERFAREAVSSIPGVRDVKIDLKSNVRSASMRQTQIQLPGVKNVIAVASGKGGVGKSTVATNIAGALASFGASVGLLDADIYGPSVPQMMGSSEQPGVENNKIIPPVAHNVKIMSMGYLTKPGQAVVWRGPMVAKALQQMLSEVDWGELDYLIVDLPPGTGDAPLTLAQSIPLTAVAVVCTPQDVAVNIAVKSVQMFRVLKVPIAGLIENMSYYICPNCGHEAHIFAHGGAEKVAKELKVPFLGAVPLEEDIRIMSDVGVPIVFSKPESRAAQAFVGIAKALAAQISIRAFRSIPVVQQV